MNRYIPIETYGAVIQGLFKSTLDILYFAFRQYKSASTKELLLKSAIGFADSDAQINLIHSWFMNDKITTLDGDEIHGLTVST